MILSEPESDFSRDAEGWRAQIAPTTDVDVGDVEAGARTDKETEPRSLRQLLGSAGGLLFTVSPPQ